MNSKAFFLLFFLLSTPGFATPPTNLSILKNDIVAYYEQGRFDQEVGAVVNKAYRFLYSQLKLRKPNDKPYALVLDVDDTAISNFEWYKNDYFVNLKESIDRSYHYLYPKPIKPVHWLYEQALANHVAVFFVSSRPSSVRKETILALKQAGFHTWQGLVLAPSDNRQLDKQAVRRNISQHYQIVLNLGDQVTDLTGGYALKSFRIPNPLYDVELAREKRDNKF